MAFLGCARNWCCWIALWTKTRCERAFRAWLSIWPRENVAASTSVICPADDSLGIHKNLASRRHSSAPTWDGDGPIDIPPRCPDCTAILRPDVVLFGEMLPDEALARLRCELAAGFGAVFSIGTSGVFPYIQEPFVAAGRRGAPTVEINPSETILTPLSDYRLPLRAAEAMDAIRAGNNLNNAARIYYGIGDYQRVVEVLNEYLDTYPDKRPARVLGFLAAAYYHLGSIYEFE